jgi:hypothetical protein
VTIIIPDTNLPEVVAAFAVPTAFCAMVAVIVTRVLAYMQARHRVAQDPSALAAVEQRLARVEVALDELTAEFGRIADGQQFLTKVLTERATADGGALREARRE